KHLGIGVKARCLLEPWSEQQREGAWPAADVEEPTAAIEREFGDQAVDYLLGVCDPSLNVVSRAARIQREIPLPLDMAHQISMLPRFTRVGSSARE
ncbi:MAG: hypothetical protein QOE40_2310, partial [Actinomycetota bacterium]|nr:hypothetical protein [Actinomycetota bacterium]